MKHASNLCVVPMALLNRVLCGADGVASNGVSSSQVDSADTAPAIGTPATDLPISEEPAQIAVPPSEASTPQRDILAQPDGTGGSGSSSSGSVTDGLQSSTEAVSKTDNADEANPAVTVEAIGGLAVADHLRGVDDEAVGRELYITASYCNHSCKPNCSITRSHNFGSLVADRDIQVRCIQSWMMILPI